jgi:Ca2+-binding RTX toxin-like protein
MSSVSYTLGANLESLTLSGGSPTSAWGNDLANVLTGNAAANTLQGLGGADTLRGGAGQRHVFRRRRLDVIVEFAGEGTDLVQSNFSYTLDANVENLLLLGASNLDATGNASNNVLTGNAAANRLDGKGGRHMSGGQGARCLRRRPERRRRHRSQLCRHRYRRVERHVRSRRQCRET